MIRTAPLAPRMLASTILGDIVECDGIVYVLSACCKASAKGAEAGVVCRACYAVLDDSAGWAALASDVDGTGEAALAEMLAPSIERFAADAARRIFASARGEEVAA